VNLLCWPAVVCRVVVHGGGWITMAEADVVEPGSLMGCGSRMRAMDVVEMVAGRSV